MSVIHKAVINNSYDRLKILLAQGHRDIDKGDYFDRTPLHYAVSRDMMQIVDLLLKTGANPNLPDMNSSIPLHNSISNQNEQITKILVEKTTDIDCKNNCGESALHIAIKNHFNVAVHMLLEKGCNVNLVDRDGNSPLHLCFLKSFNGFDIIGKLFDKGTDIDIVNNKGETALHLAVRTNISGVMWLLTRGANVNIEDKCGETPLHIVATLCRDHYRLCNTYIYYAKGQREIDFRLEKEKHVKYPIEANILLNVLNKLVINVTQKHGETVLLLVEKYGLYSACKTLLTNNAHIRISDKKVNKENLKQEAIKNEAWQLVELLIANGAELKRKDNNCGPTQIIVKSEIYFLIACQLLMEKSVDINKRNSKNQTALYAFIFSVRNSIPSDDVVLAFCKLLLDNGAHVNICDISGKFVLHIAVKTLCIRLVGLILDKGAEINCRNEFNTTPFHTVVDLFNFNGIEITQFCTLLIDNGANVNAMDNNARTPLHLISRHHYSNDYLAISQLLLEKGAEVNVMDNCGNSPLINATKKDNERLIELLLSNGADIDFKDKTGQTALHLACASFFLKTVKLLLNSGASVNIQDHKGQTPLCVLLNKHFFRTKSVDIVTELLDWGVSLIGVTERVLKKRSISDLLVKCSIKRQIVKLKPYTRTDYSNKWFCQYIKSCLKELEEMKSVRYSHNCLFDIFSKYAIPNYLSNCELEGAVMSLEAAQYPIYNTLLISTYKKAKQRTVLFKQVQDILELPLPSEIVVNILSYIDNEDLQHVVNLRNTVQILDVL